MNMKQSRFGQRIPIFDKEVYSNTIFNRKEIYRPSNSNFISIAPEVSGKRYDRRSGKTAIVLTLTRLIEEECIVRIGIIGMGIRGTMFEDTTGQNQHTELAAFAEFNDSTQIKVRNSYPVSAYGDYREIHTPVSGKR
jgi:hypothetical protein